MVDAVRRLKEQPGNNISLGCGADLLATLTHAGLIEYLPAPDDAERALGQGKALFRSLEEPPVVAADRHADLLGG